MKADTKDHIFYISLIVVLCIAWTVIVFNMAPYQIWKSVIGFVGAAVFGLLMILAFYVIPKYIHIITKSISYIFKKLTN